MIGVEHAPGTRRLVFGGAPIGGLFEPVADETAQGALESAWDRGIRRFDTAPHYGVGLSEERLGRFLAAQPRAEFSISTKVGRLLVDDPLAPDNGDGFFGTPRRRRVRDYSARGITESMSASLARLGLDRVDVALLHDPEGHMREALAEGLPELARLRAAGTIDAVGAGMNRVEELVVLAETGLLDYILVAGRLSLLDQTAGDQLLEVCQRRGVSVVVGGVFNSGILANPVPGASYDYAPAPSELVERARHLESACASYGVPLRAAAVQFPLLWPGVDAVVVGARSSHEVSDVVNMSEHPIPVELWHSLAASGLLRMPASINEGSE